ncbi:hypothetical protein [Pedobacter psychroterrae]|uniref:Lipocalin-like protein n=1 Tax=Pedobacter psychroterrae TaxID=2530453 RepID=A0A4R0NPI3_9SPHI|nr:hypothetical protein [Pedobacter psychroterrae]TCD01135.1 hypothetical protein EZ437_10225 [Pedobacter psychroterrae]
MKKLLYLSLSLMFLTLSSCEKSAIPEEKPKVEDEAPLTGEVSILEGNWELRNAYGGMGGGAGNFAPGNGDMFKFRRQIVNRYFNGNLLYTRNFDIQDSVKRINKTESTHFLDYGTIDNPFVRLKGDTLIVFLGEIAADGAELKYVKIAAAE